MTTLITIINTVHKVTFKVEHLVSSSKPLLHTVLNFYNLRIQNISQLVVCDYVVGLLDKHHSADSGY